MTPQEKQLLLQAKALIQQKEYQKARAILSEMPFNNTAQEWLARLNKNKTQTLKPVPTASIPTPASPVEPQKPLSDAASIVVDPPHDPKEIAKGIMVFGRLALIMTPFVLYRYSRNWSRLGKAWGMETFLIGLIMIIGIIFGIAYALVQQDIDYTSGTMLAGSFIGLVIYIGVLERLQKGAYAVWEKTHDLEKVRQHNYNLDVMAAVWLGLTIVLTLIVVGGISFAWTYMNRPKHFENDTLAPTYQKWEEKAPQETNFCKSNYTGCFFSLTGVGNDLFAAFSYYPIEGASAEGFARRLWQNYEEDYPKLQVARETTIMIDGTPALLWEFHIPNEQGGLWYSMRVDILTEPSLTGISIWANSKASFDQRRANVEALLANIDLKANGLRPTTD